MILAIDTSTNYAGALLWSDGKALHAEHWWSTRGHTDQLLPAIDRALRSADIAAKDLTGIVAALGPGGFSALRTGVSAAKGLALPHNVPLAGVSTLLAEAYSNRKAGESIAPLVPIGRREMAWAIYRPDNGDLTETIQPRITPIAELPEALPQGAVCCGEGVAALPPPVAEELAERCDVIPFAGPSARLWGVGLLGERLISAGQTTQPAALEPLYVGKPTITPPNPPRRVRQ